MTDNLATLLGKHAVMTDCTTHHEAAPIEKDHAGGHPHPDCPGRQLDLPATLTHLVAIAHQVQRWREAEEMLDALLAEENDDTRPGSAWMSAHSEHDLALDELRRLV